MGKAKRLQKMGRQRRVADNLGSIIIDVREPSAELRDKLNKLLRHSLPGDATFIGASISEDGVEKAELAVVPQIDPRGNFSTGIMAIPSEGGGREWCRKYLGRLHGTINEAVMRVHDITLVPVGHGAEVRITAKR